jgi:hypothetical protein
MLVGMQGVKRDENQAWTLWRGRRYRRLWDEDGKWALMRKVLNDMEKDILHKRKMIRGFGLASLKTLMTKMLQPATAIQQIYVTEHRPSRSNT